MQFVSRLANNIYLPFVFLQQGQKRFLFHSGCKYNKKTAELYTLPSFIFFSNGILSFRTKTLHAGNKQ
jgi:hypothetical protein